MRDIRDVVMRPSTGMSEFWMSNQKSASDVEPGALLVEVWNARPRKIALMAMVNMVAVTRLALRFSSGPRCQLQHWSKGFGHAERLLTFSVFWCVLSYPPFLLALTAFLLTRKELSYNS